MSFHFFPIDSKPRSTDPYSALISLDQDGIISQEEVRYGHIVQIMSPMK
jgi:hypothetical protein